MNLSLLLQEILALDKEATPTNKEWRVANEIDPNPIFLETWGPDYKTMWWIQTGYPFGEGGNSPTSSSLRNITPKMTMMSEADCKLIAHYRTSAPIIAKKLLLAMEYLETIKSTTSSVLGYDLAVKALRDLEIE